jgi:glycerol-3-phosphate acyltransferase PlsY
VAVMGVLLIWRHADNIGRIVAGTESRLGAKKP